MRLQHFVYISSIMTKRSAIDVSISAGTYFYGCLLLLLFPLELIASVFAATTIHEIFHILMLRFYRIPVSQIRINIGGITIQTAALSPKQELFCAAAGPAGSFLCLLLIRVFPLFALCGCIQGLFNLLPVMPLDGGRILRCFCLWVCPNNVDLICNAAHVVTVAAALFICILLSVRIQDSFLLLAVYFFIRFGRTRKTPCKQRSY